jgi:VanZ family protein
MPFVVCTDASDGAVGAVLANEKLIAYASKALTKAELAYNVREKEFYTVLWVCTHFLPYLYGGKLLIIMSHFRGYQV